MKQTTLKTWLFTKPMMFTLRMLLLLIIIRLPVLLPMYKKIPLPDVVMIAVWIAAMICVCIWAVYKLIKSLQTQKLPSDDFTYVRHKYTWTLVIFIVIVITLESFKPAIIYRIICFPIFTYFFGVTISELLYIHKYKQKKRKDIK